MRFFIFIASTVAKNCFDTFLKSQYELVFSDLVTRCAAAAVFLSSVRKQLVYADTIGVMSDDFPAQLQFAGDCLWCRTANG